MQIRKGCIFFAEIVHLVSRFLCIIARICLLCMILLVVYGVFVRYFLRNPTTWAVEGSAVLLLGIVMLATAYTQQVDGHVKVDLVSKYLSTKNRTILDIVSSSLALFFCISLLWTGYGAFMRSVSQNWHSQDANFVLWPAYLVIPIGALFLSLEYIIRICRNIDRIRNVRKTNQLQPITGEVQSSQNSKNY